MLECFITARAEQYWRVGVAAYAQEGIGTERKSAGGQNLNAVKGAVVRRVQQRRGMRRAGGPGDFHPVGKPLITQPAREAVERRDRGRDRERGRLVHDSLHVGRLHGDGDAHEIGIAVEANLRARNRVDSIDREGRVISAAALFPQHFKVVATAGQEAEGRAGVPVRSRAAHLAPKVLGLRSVFVETDPHSGVVVVDDAELHIAADGRNEPAADATSVIFMAVIWITFAAVWARDEKPLARAVGVSGVIRQQRDGVAAARRIRLHEGDTFGEEPCAE